MAVAFTATPDVEQGRVEIRATGGTPGDSFYILRRDRNGSNLTRETAEAGVVWQPDPASTRHNMSTNPSCEVNDSGWAQTLGAGSLSVKNLSLNPYFAPNSTELEYSRNLYANPFFFGTSGAPLGSAAYTYLTSTGSKSSSYDDSSLTLTASAMAVNSRYGLRQDGVTVAGNANVPVTIMYDYVKSGANATVVMYADFRSASDTSVQSFRLEGNAASGSLRMQVKPSGAWAKLQVYFWLENMTAATIAAATTVTVTRPGVITGIGGWNADSAEQFGGISDFGDGTDVSWAGTAHNSSSIRKTLGMSSYTGVAGNTAPISLIKNGVQSLGLMSSGGAVAQNTWVSPGGDSGALRLGLVAGKTYTATGNLTLDGPLTGTLNADARSIVAYTKIGAGAVVATKSNVAPNAAGSTECSVTFTVPAGATEAYIRLMGGAGLGEGAVFWSNFNLFESSYTGVPFTGDDQNTSAVVYTWDGTPNASASTKTALVGRQMTDAPHGKWAYQASWAFAPAVNTTPNGIKHTSLGVVAVGKFLNVYARVRSNVAKTITLKLETFTGATLRNTKTSAAYTLAANVWTPVRVEDLQITLTNTSIVVSALTTGTAFGADESIQMDMVLIEPKDAATVIYRTNLATNPSFEAGTTGIGGSANAAGSATIGLSTEWSASGTRSLKITGNGTIDYSGAYPWGGLGASVLTRMGVVAGKTYTVSVDFYQPVLQDYSWPVVARGIWFGPTGSTADMWAKAEAPNVVGVSRVVCTFTIPPGTTQMNAVFTLGARDRSGYYDNVLVEEGVTSGAYFDGGSSHSTEGRVYEWTGAPNASTSVERTPAGEFFDGSSFDPAYNGWDGTVGLSSSYLSPGSLAIVIYDYEARQGLNTDYILTDELGNVGASVSVLIPRWGTWLKDPFRPFMNCKVLWHQDSEYERKARRTLLQPRNAKYPVPQWDRRIAPSANIEVATEEDTKARALTSLLDSAGVIMIDVDDRFGVPVRYVSVGDIKGRRATSSDSLGLKWEARIWNLEIDEVAYPIGTPSGQSLTYSEVAGFFSSYIDIAATVATYDELAAGTWKTDV